MSEHSNMNRTAAGESAGSSLNLHLLLQFLGSPQVGEYLRDQHKTVNVSEVVRLYGLGAGPNTDLSSLIVNI